MNYSDNLKHLNTLDSVTPFGQKISSSLFAKSVDIFQMNVGKMCNLSCKHCHVEAGPHRKEIMSKETFQACLHIIKEQDCITTVDMTGGAPEMNENLPWFIEELGLLNKRIIVRSNLLVLLLDGYEHFFELFVKHKVEIVASLPDYNSDVTDRQRGKNVFDLSIKVIKKLNSLGYAKKDSDLFLHFVHNPVGAYLPAAQKSLENEYRVQLGKNYGIVFNSLFTITNCPIGRYLDYLIKSDNLDDYMEELEDNYNDETVKNVMCRNTVSISWDGKLYDCDFNQMIDLPLREDVGNTVHNVDFKKLKNREIALGNHCYSCTAGAGSSCQGSLE